MESSDKPNGNYRYLAIKVTGNWKSASEANDACRPQIQAARKSGLEVIACNLVNRIGIANPCINVYPGVKNENLAVIVLREPEQSASIPPELNISNQVIVIPYDDCPFSYWGLKLADAGLLAELFDFKLMQPGRTNQRGERYSNAIIYVFLKEVYEEFARKNMPRYGLGKPIVPNGRSSS